MPSLGDFFSSDQRKESAERNVKVGSVIKAFVKNTTPPKEKRFIIIAENDDGRFLAVVFINSNINTNVHRTNQLLSLQYQILCGDNEFLERDSYIDCSDIFDYDRSQVIEWVTLNPPCKLGEVESSNLEQILQLVKSSPKISRKTLRQYGLL